MTPHAAQILNLPRAMIGALAVLMLQSFSLYGMDIPLLKKEARIPLGEAKAFELPVIETKGQIVKAEIVSRIDARQAAGSHFGLKASLNERIIEPNKRKTIKGPKAIYANR